MSRTAAPNNPPPSRRLPRISEGWKPQSTASTCDDDDDDDALVLLLPLLLLLSNAIGSDGSSCSCLSLNIFLWWGSNMSRR